MLSENQAESIIRKHLDVFSEVERMDAVLRFSLSADALKHTPPWIMSGRRGLKEEENTVWEALDNGELSDEEAIQKFKKMMQMYYS